VKQVKNSFISNSSIEHSLRWQKTDAKESGAWFFKD